MNRFSFLAEFYDAAQPKYHLRNVYEQENKFGTFKNGHTQHVVDTSKTSQ